MSYVIEQWDSIELNLLAGPYTAPSDPLAVELDFTEGVVPPLPWQAPRLVVEYRARMKRAGLSESQALITVTRAGRADGGSSLSWRAGANQDLGVAAVFGAPVVADSACGWFWGAALTVDSDMAVDWSQSARRDRACVLSWGLAAGLDSDKAAPWVMSTPARDATKALPWYSVSLAGAVYDDSAGRYALLNTDVATAITLDGYSGAVSIADSENVELRFGWVTPERPSVPHDVSYRITARQAAPRDTNKHLPWGAGQSIWHDYNLPYPVEPNPAPDPVDPPEIKTVYLIMNTLQITDVATGTPLDIQGVTIGLDIDSWAWKFSGTLYGQGSLALVAPGAGGMKDVAVTINGHSWVFSIERYTSDERFPTEKFTITGVSRTQYMAAPFAPTRSYTNASATTAAQAATAELQNTGFSLTWPTGNDGDLPDWPIPAGALSFRDKSPAQVVAQIVTAAGGIMVPAMAADSWTVQPRYKVAPWNWETATPDAGIYIGMVRSRSAQYEPAPAFNACYVSGVSQGVAVDVQRAGSGGTAPMPDIYEDLITDSQPAISRGTAELAGAGNKVVETLSVLIPESGAAPGVVLPGMIVKVMHDDPLLDYMALVLAVSISVQKAGGAEIYQSVTLERSA